MLEYSMQNHQKIWSKFDLGRVLWTFILVRTRKKVISLHLFIQSNLGVFTAHTWEECMHGGGIAKKKQRRAVSAPFGPATVNSICLQHASHSRQHRPRNRIFSANSVRTSRRSWETQTRMPISLQRYAPGSRHEQRATNTKRLVRQSTNFADLFPNFMGAVRTWVW